MHPTYLIDRDIKGALMKVVSTNSMKKNILELSLLISLTVFFAVMVNLYFYQKINTKIEKLDTASKILFMNKTHLKNNKDS